MRLSLTLLFVLAVASSTEAHNSEVQLQLPRNDSTPNWSAWAKAENSLCVDPNDPAHDLCLGDGTPIDPLGLDHGVQFRSACAISNSRAQWSVEVVNYTVFNVEVTAKHNKRAQLRPKAYLLLNLVSKNCDKQPKVTAHLSETFKGPITYYVRYVYKNGHVNYTWANDHPAENAPNGP